MKSNSIIKMIVTCLCMVGFMFANDVQSYDDYVNNKKHLKSYKAIKKFNEDNGAVDMLFTMPPANPYYIYFYYLNDNK